VKTLIVVLLLLIVAGIGYFIYERESDKHSAREEERRVQAIANLGDALDKVVEDEIKQAIKEKRVIKHMTKNQVTSAKGFPDRKQTGINVSREWWDGGVREIWYYEGWHTKLEVYFDVGGRVMRTDY
jgi:hypothetical protein